MKSRQRKRLPRRPLSYRPKFDHLEDRLQPGSVLTTSLGWSMLGSWFDPLMSNATIPEMTAVSEPSSSFSGLGGVTSPAMPLSFIQEASPTSVSSGTSEAAPVNNSGAVNPAGNDAFWLQAAATQQHFTSSPETLAVAAAASIGTQSVQSAKPTQTSGNVTGGTVTPVPGLQIPGAQSVLHSSPIVSTPLGASTITATSVQSISHTGAGNYIVTPVKPLVGGGGKAAVFSTYSGDVPGGTSTTLSAIDASDDGTVYAAGVQAGAGYIVSYNNAGVLVNAVVVTNGAGDTLQLNGIQVEDFGGANANVYVVANDLTTNGAVILELDAPTLSIIVNEVDLVPPAGGSVTLNGIDLQEQGSQTVSVVVTGSTNDPANPPASVLVAKFNPALATPPIYAVNVTFGMPPVASSGNAIEVDSAGNVYIAGTLNDVPGDNVPLYLSLDNVPAVRWAFTFANPAAGPNGAGTGIEIDNDDPQGAVYVTGTLNNVPGPMGGSIETLLAKGPAATFVPLVYGFRWFIPGGIFSSNGIESNAAGNAFTVGQASDPVGTGPVKDGHITEFGPAGNTIVDFETPGSQNPMSMNPTTGLALEYNHQTQAVCATGWTQAPDFAPLVAAAQPALAGPQDGFVVCGTLPY